MSGGLRSPAIGVVQAAKDGHGADWSLALRQWLLGRDSLCHDGGGDGLSDALVGSVVVDVGDVLAEGCRWVMLRPEGERCPEDANARR